MPIAASAQGGRKKRRRPAATIAAGGAWPRRICEVVDCKWASTDFFFEGLLENVAVDAENG